MLTITALIVCAVLQLNMTQTLLTASVTYLAQQFGCLVVTRFYMWLNKGKEKPNLFHDLYVLEISQRRDGFFIILWTLVKCIIQSIFWEFLFKGAYYNIKIYFEVRDLLRSYKYKPDTMKEAALVLDSSFKGVAFENLPQAIIFRFLMWRYLKHVTWNDKIQTLENVVSLNRKLTALASETGKSYEQAKDERGMFLSGKLGARFELLKKSVDSIKFEIADLFSLARWAHDYYEGESSQTNKVVLPAIQEAEKRYKELAELEQVLIETRKKRGVKLEDVLHLLHEKRQVIRYIELAYANLSHRDFIQKQKIHVLMLKKNQFQRDLDRLEKMLNHEVEKRNKAQSRILPNTSERKQKKYQTLVRKCECEISKLEMQAEKKQNKLLAIDDDLAVAERSRVDVDKAAAIWMEVIELGHLGLHEIRKLENEYGITIDDTLIPQAGIRHYEERLNHLRNTMEA